MVDDPELVSKKFDEKWANGDQAGALDDLDEAIRLDPQNMAYRLMRVIVKTGPDLDTFDDHMEAINDFTFIIDHGSESDEKDQAYKKRSLSYMVLKQYSKALADLEWLIKEGFDSNFWIDLRSECKREAGLFEEAIQDFTQAIDERKTNELLLDRAQTFIQMGNSEAALQDLSQLTDFYKDHNSLLKRAQIYYQIGHFEDSIQDFTDLIQMNSSRPNFQTAMYQWRGKNYYRLHQFEEAFADFIQMSLLAKETPFTHLEMYIENLRLNA